MREGWEVRVPRVTNFRHFCVFQTGSGAHPTSYPLGTWGTFPGGKKAAGACCWPLTPTMWRVRKTWSYTSPRPQYVIRSVVLYYIQQSGPLYRFSSSLFRTYKHVINFKRNLTVFHSHYVSSSNSRIVAFYHRQNFQFAHKLQDFKTLLCHSSLFIRGPYLNFCSPMQLRTWELNWHNEIKVASDNTFSWNTWRNVSEYKVWFHRNALSVLLYIWFCTSSDSVANRQYFNLY
jgi:hypothetical protein